MPLAWIVRASHSSFAQVREKAAVAVGWSTHADVSRVLSQQEMLAVVKRHRLKMLAPEKEAQYSSYASQLYAFLSAVSVGDYVLTPSSPPKTVLVGKISGRDEYLPRFIDPDHPHVRRVVWLGHFGREIFSNALRTKLGLPPTIIAVDGFQREIEGLLQSSRVSTGR
jgi:predicted Mrr-cat superfamily restriction endonuclease